MVDRIIEESTPEQKRRGRRKMRLMLSSGVGKRLAMYPGVRPFARTGPDRIGAGGA